MGEPGLEVFYRPDCPYCVKLWIQFRLHAQRATWRSILRDEDARAFVASVNGGDETVPTVKLGDRTLTNPSWREVQALLTKPGPAVTKHESDKIPES